MFSIALLLLMHGLSLSLRLGGPTGSFPRPLSAREEKEALERLAAGDLSMRALLIEKNMRLVAHVIKNTSSGGTIFPAENAHPADVRTSGGFPSGYPLWYCPS